jgi:hypothetical protein
MNLNRVSREHVGPRIDIPVHACLPCCVAEAVAHIQNHRADIVAAASPIEVEAIIITAILPLKCVASSPDSESQNQHDCPSNLRASSSPNIGEVQREPEQTSTEYLRQPIQRIVECARPHIETCIVDVVELVCVKPIRGEEHRKEENNVGIRTESLPKTENLGLPGWMFHHDDSGAVAAYNVFGVEKCPGEAGAEKCEDYEADIRSVGDSCWFDGVSCIKVQR